MLPRPLVFEYLDYLQFIRDWHHWRTETPPGLTYREFSSRSGLSHGYLSNILNGDRIPDEHKVGQLALGVELEPKEEAFFLLLIQLARAASWQERSAILEQIFRHPNFMQVDAIPAQRLEYLTRWHYVAIRELWQRPDFQENPAWIAQHLAFPVSEEEIQHGVELIKRLRLHPDVTPEHLQTPSAIASATVFTYHQNMLKLAAQALEQVSDQQRQYQAGTLVIPESIFPQVKQEIERFIHQISNLCAHTRQGSSSPTQVYQLQVQLFPLSR
jgi:uncharacterized protein (TIGR02147 family)